MNKIIEIPEQFSAMISYSILIMADEHKRISCKGEKCGVTLFPLRDLIKQLLGRPLSDEELKILS